MQEKKNFSGIGVALCESQQEKIIMADVKVLVNLLVKNAPCGGDVEHYIYAFV